MKVHDYGRDRRLRLGRLSSKREQCRVDSWRTKPNTDLFVCCGDAAFPAAVRGGRARGERREATAGAAASAASAGGDGRQEETTAAEVRRGGRHQRRPETGRRECAPSSSDRCQRGTVAVPSWGRGQRPPPAQIVARPPI